MKNHQLDDKLKAMKLLEKELHGFRCPVCSKDEFVQIDLPEKNIETKLSVYEGDDPMARKHFSMFAVACTNCGRVEQFLQFFLTRRVQSEQSDE